MSDDLTPLILDFLEWVARAPRSYADVMDAWRTSCPRLTVWEDATEQGLIMRRRSDGGIQMIELTPLGREFLLQKPAHKKTAARTLRPSVRQF